MGFDSATQRRVGVVLSYANMAMQIVISLVYTPVMLSLLGQSGYGLYSLSSSTISYLSLITLGMGGAYTRFYIRYKVKNDEKGIRSLNGMYLIFYFLAAMVAIVAGGTLVMNAGSIFISLTAEEIETTQMLLALLMANLAVSFPASLFSSYITANESFILQRMLQLVKTVFSPLVVLPVLLMGYGTIGYAFVTVAFNLLVEIFNVIYATARLGMRFSFRNFKLSLFREVAIFSLFLLLNQVIDQVNSNVDNFLLGIFQGSMAVAVYGVARQITTVFFSFSTTISSVYAPRVNEMVASGSSSKALSRLMASIGRVQFVIMALVLSGLYFFGRPFIVLWAGDGYVDAWYIILLLCTPVMVPLIQNIGLEIQRAMNRHQIRSVVYAVMAGLNVAISIPLVKSHGAIGAAIGTSISYVLCNCIFMNIYYHKGLNLDMVFFWKEIARFIPALVVPLSMGIVLNCSDVDLYSWTTLFLCAALYTMVYVLSMWLVGLNRKEKDFVLRALRRKNIDDIEVHTSKGRRLNFRDKTNGWQKYELVLDNGKRTLVIPHSEDAFMKAFLSDYILRPSCYSCTFKGSDGFESDMTLGDFWNIDNCLPYFNDDKGVSEVIVRTEKGRLFFSSLEGLESIEVSEMDAYQGALYHSPIKPDGREDWFQTIQTHSVAMTNELVIPLSRKASYPVRVAKAVFRRLYSWRRTSASLAASRPVFNYYYVKEKTESCKASCCGCSACASICPKVAITMVGDAEGFKYPVVDPSLCVDCGLCEKACPILSRKNASEEALKFFAARNLDLDERLASSSGGVFSILARKVLGDGGVVFGAAFYDGFKVCHRSIQSVSDLPLLMGSKYVQSEMGICYQEAKTYLENGRLVLFSGTPCQIAGLRSFLRKEYHNLLAVDIICHGVPSPAAFDKYLIDMKMTGGGCELQR